MKRAILILIIVLFACSIVCAEEAKVDPKWTYFKFYDVAWHCVAPAGDGYNWYNITGKIKNVSDKTYSGVLLDFSIFDSKGVKIAIVQQAGILNLKPGDVSEFSTNRPICATPSNGNIPYKFRLDDIKYVIAE
jgi:hypothetical protein